MIGEFGLSMHVEVQRGSEVRNVLVDFGFTAKALNNNLALLGIDPGSIDAFVLSHGHYDHFGGMAGFFKAHGAQFKRGVPLYLGGEEAFCSREWTGPPVAGNFGVIDRKAIPTARVHAVTAEHPTAVADFCFTTGKSRRGRSRRRSPRAG